jgi:hypothetical protein
MSIAHHKRLTLMAVPTLHVAPLDGNSQSELSTLYGVFGVFGVAVLQATS